jgi:uncharacterized membrane protein
VAHRAIGDEFQTMNRIFRLIRHRWMDATDARRAVPDDMAARLTSGVIASELRHTGQIRVCVECALPTSYLWRVGHRTPLSVVVRQRALAWFGRLRVWDTERNNGVLIYLLLAERAIELVADRGVARRVPAARWQSMVDGLGGCLHQGDVEAGLSQALAEVSAVLVEHFPAGEGEPCVNELPDLIVRV